MNRWREKLYRFMEGRYGQDDLGRFLMVVLLVCVVLSIILRSALLDLVFWILLIWVYFRMFSRNISRRYEENRKFLDLKYRLKQNFGSARASRDPANRIFRCPGCGQRVRVPKGKGRISIHCPKCKKDFIKRT